MAKEKTKFKLVKVLTENAVGGQTLTISLYKSVHIAKALATILNGFRDYEVEPAIRYEVRKTDTF